MKGAISYIELGALDIHEFFVTLASYEEEIDEEIKSNKALQKK